MEDNEAAREIMEDWLEPLNDLGANISTVARIGATDHLSFIRAGLPGAPRLHRLRRTNASYERRYVLARPGAGSQAGRGRDGVRSLPLGHARRDNAGGAEAIVARASTNLALLPPR